MEKKYEKPVIEIEEYHLSDKIATGCKTIVDLGPGYFSPTAGGFVSTCDSYKDSVPQTTSGDVSWYGEDDAEYKYNATCTCYHTAGDSTLLTS